MTAMAEPSRFLPPLSPRDFRRIGGFVSEVSGIKLPPAKRAMVEGRLRRRVRGLGFADFSAYCRFVFDDGGLEQESVHIIDAVTTNKTEFFREPDHFRVLTGLALPHLAPPGRVRPVKLWSAACSNGAEPYTLAMVLAEYAGSHPGFDFAIAATDLCTEVLRTAALGIYPEAEIEPVPPALRRRYLLRSRDRSRGKVRIAPELRAKVRFLRLNLMDQTYGVKGPFDVIFCRNVLIYFDKPTQAAVVARLCDHLAPGGFLFLGHSETVAGFGMKLRPVAPTVFVKE